MLFRSGIVGLVPSGELVVIDPSAAGAPARPPVPDEVLVTAGEDAGSTARLVGLAGTWRQPGGGYHPSGFIEAPDADGTVQRRVVPLADLERLG